MTHPLRVIWTPGCGCDGGRSWRRLAALTGENDCGFHFNRDDLPPVHAFWSVARYDAQGFQAVNPPNRYPVRYNPGGSLDLPTKNTPVATAHGNSLPGRSVPLAG